MTTSSDVITPGREAAASSGGRDPSLPLLIAGIVLMVISIGLLFTGSAADPARPFLGYLVAVSFWASILVGMLFLVMVWWLFDAGWSVIIRRQLEHFLAAFPVIGVVMVPLVALGVAGSDAVAWTWMNLDAEVAGAGVTVAEDVLYLHKAPYLNTTFFVLRFILIIGVWVGLAHLLRQWSFRMDETGDHKYVHWSRRLSALGMFVLALVTTMASVDWFMSLNFHWFSTMFGVWFFSASMRAALSATVLVLFWQAARDDGNGLKGIVKPAHFYLMGCIMLAFTVFWAYISFSQYFLIYNANIPEETFWYNIREKNPDGSLNSWWWVSMVLMFLHFFVPFIYLLFYKCKFGARLKFIAVWILAIHLLDIYFNVLPQKLPSDANILGYEVRQFLPGLTDVTVFLGVGALVLWAFVRSTRRFRPIPVRDPRIHESLNCHE